MIPRPYQVEGIAFLQSKRRAGLTDDPGLGKTLQAALAAHTPAIVACPTYLVDQWYNVLTDQFPTLNIRAATGSSNKRLKAIYSKPDWLIINIEMFRNYDFYYPDTLIIDEAHHIRVPGSQQSKGARQLAQTVPRVHLLTATPIVKENDDVWHLLHILDQRAFRSYAAFVKMFCEVTDTGFGPKVVGPKHEAAFRVVMSRYFLGRTYKQVGLYLPDLIESTIDIAESRTFYKDYRTTKEGFSFGNIEFANVVSTLMFLRQMTRTQLKVQTTLDLIEDLRDKTVVFTWFKDSCFELANHLKCPAITGELDPTSRKNIANQHHQVIVATIPSLSEGVDLSYARNVIFFEEDYTPGVMHQALSRVRRYSTNTNPVRVYYIHVRNTIDEVVHQMVERRIFNIQLIFKEAMK